MDDLLLSERKAAERVTSLKPSSTVEMTERVRQARASGRPVIGLSSGDPNIATDARIIAAATRAMQAGETHYGPPVGQLELREAIVQRELARCGVRYDPSDILVTPGGKFALLTALMGVVEPGDEVIIPEPGWVSYGPCVRLAAGIPVSVPLLHHFDVRTIDKAVGPRTKAVIINSPVNPTGRIIPRTDMEALVDLAQRRGFWLIFDQVYADLTYEKSMTFPQAMGGGKDCTFVIDSLSKTFGMTGWRLGYLAVPNGLSKVIQKFLQHSIYCVPPFIQAAGIMALSLFDELVPGYRDLFHRRIHHAAQRLSQVEGITCEASDATFYLFPKISGNDVATAKRWLDEENIAVLPGSSFGPSGAGYLRLSLTVSNSDLDQALARIARVGVVA
jgi:aspartate/methionine/tyrosine aminotransferase